MKKDLIERKLRLKWQELEELIKFKDLIKFLINLINLFKYLIK
jgi:hypothetical protein